MSIQQEAKLAALMVKGGTVRAMADSSGMCRQTVSKFVEAMHAEGVAYISGYARDAIGRRVVPIHKLGRGRSKPKPPALTPAEKQKAYRQRQKKSGKSTSKTARSQSS